MSALFDTSVLMDYLRGVAPADAAVERFPHGAMTVTSWLEIMRAAPEGLVVRTRDVLRAFPRLVVSEAVADRALALMQQYPRLQSRHAVPWAAAQLHSLVYVTADFPRLDVRDDSLLVAYRRRTAPRRERRRR